MKRIIFYIMVAAMMAACSNDNDNNVLDDSFAKITFNVTGDFTLTTHDLTRSLTADNKDMTDVWCLDYVDGVLQQQIHQTSDDDDFGTPTINLSMGTHHIYFVASRGQAPVLNTDAKTLTFTKVLDTFWCDYPITITTATAASGSRSVSLDRIVTRLKVTFTDAIPIGAATFNLTPASWHYGFNYTTGNPITAASNKTVSLDIPSESIGQTGVFLSLFGFSGTTEWTTDIALNCKKSDNTILGTATITDAPFLRNRSSDYTGPLFSDNGAMTLSLNATWDDSYQGSW